MMSIEWNESVRGKIMIILISILAILCSGMLLSVVSPLDEPEVITYPYDIVQDTPAPIYQDEFDLEDAIFSSRFESGNLRSAK